MENLDHFNIDLFQLKNKEYDFDYKITDSFFKLFENALLDQGELTVHLNLIKSETLIQLKFKIKGEIELSCDRSLDLFLHPITLEKKLILKYGEVEEVISDDLEIISRGRTEINIAQYIYEFIGLAIPLKKLHPRYQAEEENEDDETVLIYSSEEADSQDQNQDPSEEQESDPRWNALKKLKKD